MAGPIRISILANGKQARAEATLTARTFGGMGRTLARSGALLGIGGLVAGTVGLAKSAISTEAQFSQRMNLIAAATKAPAKEMGQLNDLAIKLGADTSFSANEAADAMLELAKAGLDTKTIMGGGVAGTLQLAAAGGTELSTAATIASNAMNTFNLEGSQMAEVAAALAGGANASSASAESLGQGLQQVGPGAATAGLSLQETVAALSAFDAAGVKGSDAGTSLKTMLARLVPSNDKAAAGMETLGLNALDAEGNFRSLEDIAGQLQRGMRGLSDAERTRALSSAFGSDASRAAIVLAEEGTAGIRKYIGASSDQSAAEKMAAARMKGTAGATERLSGAVETAQLRLGQELAPVVESVADGLSANLVPAMDGVIQGAKDFGGAVAPAVTAVTDALDGLVPSGDAAASVFNDYLIPSIRTLSEITAGVVGFVDDLPGPIKSVGIQAGIAALVLPRLTAGLVATGSAMRNTATYAGVLNLELRDSNSRAQLTQNALTKMGGVAKNVAGIGGLLALTSGLGDATSEGLTFGGVMKGAAGGAGIGAMFGPVGALVGAGVGGGLTALVGAFKDTTEKASQTRLELMRAEGFKEAKADADSLRGALIGVVDAYGQIPRAAVQASFTGKDGKLDKDIALLRSLGVSMDTVVSASMGQASAQKIVDDALGQGITKQQEYIASAQATWDKVKDGTADLVTSTGQVIKNGTSLTSEQMAIYRKAYEDSKKPIDELKAAQDTFGQRIDQNTGVIRDHAQQMKTLAGQLGVTVAQYKTFPKAVRTKFEAEGLPQTSQDAVRLIGKYKGLQNFKSIRAVISAPGVDLSRARVEKLAKQYKLTPKQVRTLFRLEGVGKAEGEAKGGSGRIKRNLQGVDAKVTLKGWLSGIKTAINKGANITEGERKTIINKLEAIEKARPDLAPYVASVRTAVNNAQTSAKGSTGVGNQLKSGLLGGMYGTGSALSAIMSGAVRQAIAAARAAARVRSPSRETHYIGRMLGDGLVDGMAARQGAARKGGRNIVRELLAGVVNGTDGVEKSLDKVSAFVDKTYDQRLKAEQKRLRGRLKGKALSEALNRAERANAAARRGAVRGLRDENKALIANGRAQDKVAAALQNAQQAYRDARAASAQYSASIKQAFMDYGDITNLGQNEDGTVSSTNLVDELKDRAAAADRFADLISKLSDAGLSPTAIQDLLDKGVDGGLATAEALVAGGSTVITQVNQLTAQIAKAGGGLGDAMAKKFYGAGIQAAAGLVKGLEVQSTKLDRAATRLGNQMVKAIKKELGIKSPSRVFRSIGDQSVRGLALGLDETYVRRQGASLATSLQEGFGVPGLEAMAATSISSANASNRTLRLVLTAQEVDRLIHGRELIADIDAALDKGARTKHLMVTRSNA